MKRGRTKKRGRVLRRDGLTLLQEWKLGVDCCLYLTLGFGSGILVSLLGATGVILLWELCGGGVWIESHWHELTAGFAFIIVPLMARDIVRGMVEFCEERRRKDAEDAEERLSPEKEEAIIAVLKEGGLWMPSSIVGRLRDRFEPASIRPTLEDMHRRRMIAAHGYAYCHPDEVGQIRSANLRTLQREQALGQFQSVDNGPKEFDRVWEALEAWTGFGERNLALAHFKTMRLPK